MPLLSRSSGAVSLFDIRLDDAKKNVIVVRGSPGHASSLLLTGQVVLALTEPMSVKKISLKLMGKVHLQWTDNSTVLKTGSARHYRYESPVYEKEWPNLELGATLNSTSVSAASSAGNSTTNIAGLTGSNNNSSASLAINRSASSSQLSSTASHTLPQGNHVFPFETILPGSIDESVEGMEGGFVVYKIVATVERGRFANNLTCQKHVRVIRTLGSDILELSQSVSIDNTWPQKIDYTISLPNKAIALGSVITIDLEMTPLLKGLKLGTVRVWLTEQIALATPTGGSFSYERNVIEHTIPPPPEGTLNEDLWSLSRSFSLPADLSKCTQDCTIHSYIKVGHKLKFAIALKNPDGHTSELRASLPVYVFISPNVPISTASASENVVLFGANASSSNTNTSESLGVQSSDLLEISAPPNYEDHIYDRLWNDIGSPNFNTPINSGSATPATGLSRRGSFDHHGFTPVNVSSLSGLSNSSTASNSSANLNHLSSAQARSKLVDNLHELQRQQRANDEIVPVPEGNNAHTRTGVNSANESSASLGALAEALQNAHNSGASSPNSGSLSLPRYPPPVANLRRSGANSAASTPGNAAGTSLYSDTANSGNSPGYFGSDGALSSSASRLRIPSAAITNPAHPEYEGSYSPEFFHMSPNMPSTPHGGSYGNLMASFPNATANSGPAAEEIESQLQVLSRVPSYETAVNSDFSSGTDEAPSYANISNVVNRAFQGSSPSQTPGAKFRSARSVTNLENMGNSHHYNQASTSFSSSTGTTTSLRRAAESATQLSTHFFGSLVHSGQHGSVSAGASSSALSSHLAHNTSLTPAGPASTAHRSKNANSLRPSSRPGSGPNSRVGSRPVSRSNSLARSPSSGSASNGLNGLSMTTYPASANYSGSTTPQTESNNVRPSGNASFALGPESVSRASSHTSLHNLVHSSNNINSAASGSPSNNSGSAASTPGSTSSPFGFKSLSGHKSKPTSGASTPTLSSSQRSQSSRSLIGEATKLLHLTKLSQKQ